MAAFRKPLNKSSASATAALRDGMHDPVIHKCGGRIPYAGRSHFAGPSCNDPGTPFVRSLTKQTARKALSLRVTAKSSAHRVALVSIVDQATTCVVRLVIIPILYATCPRGIYSEVPWGITKRVKGVKHDVFNNRSCRRSADGQLPGSGTRCQR
jgi:hypothetical protein